VDSSASGDLSLRVQVATDSGFGSLVTDRAALPATAAHDGCLKVKVTGLSAGTTYYYRFILTSKGAAYASRTGRTRTAKASAVDAKVSFAVLNCQDYIGRYYNTTQHLVALDLDLDFVLAIGDYIYETTGDPSFQAPTAGRSIVFNDAAGAIHLGSGSSAYQAAKSVDNYRQLYRTYRADKQLQALHEKYPFILTWDDHEYSNDCWGDVATYSNGRQNEKDTTRRVNSEQAFFEFQAIDDGSPDGVIDTPRSALYPNTKLWRAFTFGKNLELVMTDFRSFRPDHPVPEDGFPGTVVLDKNTINALPNGAAIYASLSQDLFAYVNIDDAAYNLQRSYLVAALSQGYNQAGLALADASAKAAAVVAGNLAVVVINSVLHAAGADTLLLDTAGKDKGLAFAQIGKQDLFSELGSRYLCVKSTYDLYTGVKYAASAKASENAWGDAQEAFIKDRLKNSDRAFKVMVSSTSLTPMTINLTAQPVPALLKQVFYLDCDEWDGFPNKRAEFIAWITANQVKNLAFVCGDIHGGFMSKIAAGTGNDIPVLTSPAISSQTFKEEIRAQAAALNLGATGDALVNQLETILTSSNPEILFTQTDVHGFAVVEVDASGIKSTQHLIPYAEVTTDYSAKPAELAAKFTTKAYSYANGVISAA
jgi:alkaline phosphatase D